MRDYVIPIAFLALLFALWAAWVAMVLYRRPLNPGQNFVLFMDRLITSMFWRTTSPPLVLPPDRGAVVVCNHRSSVDPFFVQRATSRPIYWMVAKEFVEHPAFAWFLRTCAVIPVGRGGIDTAATKAAMRHLRDGRVVGMFPEGRINMSDKTLLPGRPGAAMVAIKERCCIVACYIEGAPYRKVAWSPLMMPARVKVRFGEVIDAAYYASRIADGEDDQAVTNELLLRLMKELAILAGHSEFEPQLAGKNWKPTAEEIANPQ